MEPNETAPAPEARPDWRERLRRRRRAILRRIEYKRLKRIRHRTVPRYVRCKNCGETLQGMYCHRCGQYALDTEQPFGKYILQYFENVYQLDGKVWQTLYQLFRRPGFLAQEFNAGKIRSYVHPLRLFMFLSAIFFLVVFLFVPADIAKSSGFSSDLPSLKTLTEEAAVLQAFREVAAEEPLRSVWVASARETFEGLEELVELHDDGGDTLRVTLPDFLISKQYLIAAPADTVYWRNDHPQLPAELRWQLAADEEVNISRGNLFYLRTTGWMAKWLPVILLLLIPLFALLLGGFFRKRCMRYMYHFVLALHLHSALLILLLLTMGWCLAFGFSAAAVWTASGLFLLHTLLALRRIYGNGWIKSALKTVSLYGIYLLLAASLLIAFIVVLTKVYIDSAGPGQG